MPAQRTQWDQQIPLPHFRGAVCIRLALWKLVWDVRKLFCIACIGSESLLAKHAGLMVALVPG